MDWSVEELDCSDRLLGEDDMTGLLSVVGVDGCSAAVLLTGTHVGVMIHERGKRGINSFILFVF